MTTKVKGAGRTRAVDGVKGEVEAPRRAAEPALVTRSEDTAEAKPTLPEKKAAAADQFAKADAAVDNDYLALRRANSGF